MEELAELRKHVQSGKLAIGTKEVNKLLKLNKLTKVFVAANCQNSVKENLKSYCAAPECQLVELAVPNDELGVLCRKPFSIAVVGVLK